MIDHTGHNVSDAHKSRDFYLRALEPLGYQVLHELPPEVAGSIVFGLGAPPHADFWIVEGEPQTPRIHTAFRAETREQVHAFYEAALAAGGTDNGAPGLRPHYHQHYYGAFVLDPDGYNIEVVCHTEE